MSTSYVINRNSKNVITKQQVLTCYPDAYVSDDAAKEGKTQQTVDVSLGVNEGGHVTWLTFSGDRVVGADVYGRTQAYALDVLSDATGVDFVSEHDSDFDYHNFPVDVKTATPIKEKDGWQVFQCGDYVYLYNKAADSFYVHIERKVDEYNIDDMIAEAE